MGGGIYKVGLGKKTSPLTPLLWRRGEGNRATLQKQSFSSLSFRVQGNGIEKSVVETESGNGKFCELIDLSTGSRGQTMTPSVTSGHLPHGGRLELSLRDGYGVNEKTNSTFIPLSEGESEERAGGVCVRRPVSNETGLGRKSPHGPLPTSYGKLAFTLVELIVVIVIVGVLATIAFLAFGNYPKQARDVVRISNLKEIEKAIEFYKIKDGDYPIPTGGQTNTGVIEGYSGIVWYKGTFGEDLVSQIQEITKLPLDPKTNAEYTYELTKDLQSYRLTTNLEIKNKDTGTKEYTMKNKIIYLESCLEILKEGQSIGSGIYTIGISGEPIEVYCDMTTDGGGWTRIIKDHTTTLVDLSKLGDTSDIASTFYSDTTYGIGWGTNDSQNLHGTTQDEPTKNNRLFSVNIPYREVKIKFSGTYNNPANGLGELLVFFTKKEKSFYDSDNYDSYKKYTILEFSDSNTESHVGQILNILGQSIYFKQQIDETNRQETIDTKKIHHHLVINMKGYKPIYPYTKRYIGHLWIR